MAKLTFLAGAATGYVLGARAGRNRYEQIRQQWQRFLANPKVQDTRTQLTQQATQLLNQGKSRVSQARQQGGSSGSGGASSGGAGAGDVVVVDPDGTTSYDVVEIPTTRSEASTDGSTL